MAAPKNDDGNRRYRRSSETRLKVCASSDSGFFTTLFVMALRVTNGVLPLLFYQNMRVADRPKESDIYRLGKIDRCTVYLIDKNMYQPLQVYLNRAKEAIVRQHIDCEHQGC